jgi:UDP-N-acetyl-D-galactosamine dehydrogenase
VYLSPALINELAIIFDRLGIDTLNVLEAAGSKWNFLPFRPGLVGGHCIGVDPYYLTYKAEMEGYHPEVILAGRRINDNMGQFIAQKTVKMMIQAGHNIKGSRVGVLGLTFKEDCPDLRNSKVIDIINELKSYSVDVYVHDPMADKDESLKYYNIELSTWEEMLNLDTIILAVGHKFYRGISVTEYADKIIHRGCLIDVKSIVNVEEVKKTGINYWRL